MKLASWNLHGFKFGLCEKQSVLEVLSPAQLSLDAVEFYRSTQIVRRYCFVF